MQKLLRRLSSVLALIAATLVLDGCENGQHLLLIEVFSTEDVAQIEVDLISLDVARPPYTQAVERYTPARTPEGLRTDPIRVSVELEGPAMVMVHIRGQTSSGETLVATRCYGVDGILQDEVVLFPIAGVDADGDSFVADPNGVCREPTEDGGVRNCNALDFTCADDFAADCNDDPGPVDGSELTGADIYPGARTFCQNGIDEDCDGSDEPCEDADDDGYNGCPPVAVPGCDCNDDNPGIYPGAPEICGDGIDQDCDGEDLACDEDDDGFRACGAEPTPDCDCDDDDATVHPGAPEMCDGKDNNCNGQTDELDECRPANLDGDPADACASDVLGTPEQASCDCNDCDAGIYGGPQSREICGNGIDDDCDMLVDEGCPPSLPDTCATAEAITLSASGTATVTGTLGAFGDDYQTNALCSAASGGRDAVYYIDLPAGRHDVTIDTIGSAADTVLAVGFDCSASGFSAVCNDDYDHASVTQQSRIWLHNVGGFTATRVYILVDGYDGSATGGFVLNIDRNAVAPDTCPTGGGAFPLEITGGGTVVGFITGVSGSQRGSCQPSFDFDPEAIFRVRGPTSGQMDFEVYSLDFTPDVYLREAPCGSGTELGCDLGAGVGGGIARASIRESVTSGDLHYFFVDGGRGGYAVYYTPY